MGDCSAEFNSTPPTKLAKPFETGVDFDKSELVDLLLGAWVKWQQGENIEICVAKITPRRKGKNKKPSVRATQILMEWINGKLILLLLLADNALDSQHIGLQFLGNLLDSQPQLKETRNSEG